jgi:hypothetical protein
MAQNRIYSIFGKIIFTIFFFNLFIVSAVAGEGSSAWSPIVAKVQVLDQSGQPMPEMMVIAFNHDYYFQYQDQTDEFGRVEFKCMPGEWSFFAYEGWVRALGHKGTGYLPCVLKRKLSNSIEQIILQPDTAIEIQLTSSIGDLINLDETNITVVEATTARLCPVETTGVSLNGNLTLYTQQNLKARISIYKPASSGQPGLVFLSEPVNLEGSITINISPSNTGRLRFEFMDIYGNPSSGSHIQFQQMERSLSWSPFISDYGISNPSFIMSPHHFFIIAAVDVWEDDGLYRLRLNNKSIKIEIGSDLLLKYGGHLDFKVLATPKAAPDFKPATQVMLYTTDSSKNVVYECWGPQGKLKPYIRITTESGKEVHADMELCFASKLLDEFDPSENPQYEITYDLGPFGKGTISGNLYDPEVIKMAVYETDRLIPQSPKIDLQLRKEQVNYYDELFKYMEELLGVPTDYKIGVISNIMHAGFEDEILHGFKLELPLEIDHPPNWPLGNDFIGHEMGHGRIHKPPANFFLIRSYAEAYATLMGYKARSSLLGNDELFKLLMGRHDLFLRHQHGDPVIAEGDYIEIMTFITHYLDQVYGWQIHRRMILEWANAFVPARELLANQGYSDIEQVVILYSYLAGENLAWLFQLGNFNIESDRIDSGIQIIRDDQTQTQGVELVIGSVTAETNTVNVPIMIRRCIPQGFSNIEIRLGFDPNLASVINVYKRDLTFKDSWNINKSVSNGQLTIQLWSEEPISGLGSIAQVNFKLAPGITEEVPITVLYVSVNGLEVYSTDGKISVGLEPAITSSPILSDGILNSTYSVYLAAQGGKKPYSWSLIEGNLPSGLNLYANSGLISGVPTNIGEFSFKVQLMDANMNYSRRLFFINVKMPLCEGDFDGDGDVDGSDLAIFAADFGRTDCGSGPPCEGDFDHDGDVDGTDLAIFSSEFGRTDCPR